jgi:hypothetical protein
MPQSSKLIAPPAISAASLDEAMGLALRQDRWLLASITSPHTANTPSLDQAAWQHADVAMWLEQHGLAIMLPADDNRELIRTLAIRALPTIVAFWGGQERERLVGLENGRLASWLSTLHEGRTRPDVAIRRSLAKILLSEKRYDDATGAYAWLWNNMLQFDTSWKGVRLSVMLREIEELVRVHPLARPTFHEIRTASIAGAQTFDPSDSLDSLVDWLALNEALDEDSATLEWFDKLKREHDAAPRIAAVAEFLWEPLKRHRRWLDIGRLFPDPVARLKKVHTSIGLTRIFGSIAMETERRSTINIIAATEFRSIAMLLYGALNSAGRTSEAAQVRQEALRLDASDEMRLALENAPVALN